MIPKIIHYCWLSGEPFPKDILYFLNTWKKKLPDYEFVLWDTKRFDINSSVWVKQAFENKKYAFAADYIRLYALYHYGGIYLDTDIEVLKSYTPLLEHKMMLGLDYTNECCEVATWGAEKGLDCMKSLLEYYDNKSFVKSDGTFDMEPMPKVVKRVLLEKGYNFINVKSKEEVNKITDEKQIPVYPHDWFCPLEWYTFKLHKTKNTYSIHRFKGAWLSDSMRKERAFLSKLGPYLPAIIRKLQRWFN